MRNFKLQIDEQILISGFLVLMGGLCLLGNFDFSVIRRIVDLVWPLTLIATGVYGILWRNWRRNETIDAGTARFQRER
jgi:hypothetical protein